jgi:hypothetical protein
MATRIISTVRNGEVYVRCGDIVKSLYIDLADTESSDIRKYIKANIEVWEEYERDVLEQAKQH